MQPIQMILCDLDGTLLNPEGMVSQRTRNAIHALREKGILFGIATGRSLHGVQKLVEDWKIKEDCDILMGFNGAELIDHKLGIHELQNSLNGEYLKEIANHYLDMDVNLIVYDDGDMYCTRDDAIGDNIAKNNYFTKKHLDINTFFENKSYIKILVATKPELMDLVIERSKTFQSPHYRCFRSAPTLFEYVHPNVSKSHGIKHICDLHGFSMENVCVFGDAQNDMEMIRDCGYGICMENGDPQSKAVAKDIALSNAQDGVADYIERHFL